MTDLEIMLAFDKLSDDLLSPAERQIKGRNIEVLKAKFGCEYVPAIELEMEEMSRVMREHGYDLAGPAVKEIRGLIKDLRSVSSTLEATRSTVIRLLQRPTGTCGIPHSPDIPFKVGGELGAWLLSESDYDRKAQIFSIADIAVKASLGQVAAGQAASEIEYLCDKLEPGETDEPAPNDPPARNPDETEMHSPYKLHYSQYMEENPKAQKADAAKAYWRLVMCKNNKSKFIAKVCGRKGAKRRIGQLPAAEYAEKQFIRKYKSGL